MMDRVRLLQLREDLRKEDAVIAERLSDVQTTLAGIEKLLTSDQPKPRRSRLAGRNTDIVAAIQSGERQEDVAKRFGITQQRVSQIMRASQSLEIG